MTESEVEYYFSGVKTVQNSKTEGGIKRTKHENVKLGGEDVRGWILTREKPSTTSVSVQEISVCFPGS